MYIKRILSFILIMAIACFIVGCDESSDARVYFELSEIPKTLDPQTASTDAELLIVRNLYEGLMRIDDEGNLANGVAERHEKNGNEYTFYLNRDAKWDSGEELTADDFVFGFRRAVDPKTNSPFAKRLMCIMGAKEINAGIKDITALGVLAVDKHTLKITLSEEDAEFLNTLTMAPCMPCNEEFFESCVGKYGLEQKCVLANGSYYLAKWNQNEFGIRIYKNAQYFGNFKAQNGGVFLSKSNKNTALNELLDKKVDAAFLRSSEILSAKKSGYEIQSLENICWLLTISGEYSSEMRSAFAMSIDRESLINDEDYGITAAYSVYPGTLFFNGKLDLQTAISGVGVRDYDAPAAKTAFSAAVKRTEDKKFPKTTLYYYNDEMMKPVINDMIGHWQKTLSAFINMEASDNLEVLQREISQPSLQMAVFPVTAKSDSILEYINMFAKTNTARPQDTIIPICFDSTNIAYQKTISNLKLDTSNGYIDFSFVLKEE